MTKRHFQPEYDHYMSHTKESVVEPIEQFLSYKRFAYKYLISLMVPIFEQIELFWRQPLQMPGPLLR